MYGRPKLIKKDVETYIHITFGCIKDCIFTFMSHVYIVNIE